MGKFDGLNQEESMQYLEALQTELRSAGTDKIMTIQADLRELKQHIEGNRRTWAVNSGDGEQRSDSSQTYVPGKGFTPVTGGSPDKEESRAELNEKYEKRAAMLREGKPAAFTSSEVAELRAITVASSGIVTAGVTGGDMVSGQLQVGSIVDKVFNLPLLYGESYKQSFEISTADAGVTGEGADSTDAEPTFGYSDINKLRFTSYAELSSQVIKLSPVQYSAFVLRAVQDSIRKTLAKHIVAGAGGTTGLAGIASATTASGLVTAQSLSTIDGTTLDSIVFAYGGDLSMGIGTLILKKADLAKFAAVRTTNGDPVYTIKFDNGNQNAGTISGRDSYAVPYVITDQLAALSAAGTATDAVCMAYGDLAKYYLVNFSDIEVQMSTDYQFKKGNVAFRGELYAGGGICGYQAFELIKKV